MAPSHPFVFHGDEGEFFRIWIVNTLLTLVTAGIFFPWAKVRKRRYIRASTELMGHRFDYRANPFRLLVGHLLVAAFFLGYSVFGVVYPVVRWSVLIVAVAMLPWIVVRSLSFNAHNTVYRGLRFRFRSSLSPAVSVFLLQPILVVVTLGLYYPAWQREKRRFIVSGHRLGDGYFNLSAPVGAFYIAYLLGGVIIFGGLLVAGALTVLWVQLNPGRRPDFLVTATTLSLYALGLWLARQIMYPRLFNHVWNHTGWMSTGSLRA